MRLHGCILSIRCSMGSYQDAVCFDYMIWQYSADVMLPTSIVMLNSQFILTPREHSSKWVPNENRIKKNELTAQSNTW
jgi:hypothetical protein